MNGELDIVSGVATFEYDTQRLSVLKRLISVKYEASLFLASVTGQQDRVQTRLLCLCGLDGG